MPRRERWLCLEAFCLSGMVRLALLVIPFRRLSLFLGRQAEESPWTENSESVKVARAIGWAVETASRYTPWESKCLVQALVAKIMLRQLGIANTLYLGVARDDRKSLAAHAWLRCGGLVVTGGRAENRFTTVGNFADCQ
jgi:hypothetical protein